MTTSRTAPAQPPRPLPIGRAVRLILGGSLLAALLFSGFIGYTAYADFLFHVRIERQHLAQDAALAARTADHGVDALAVRLNATADLVRRHGTEGTALRSALAGRWNAVPGLGRLAVVSPDGIVRFVLHEDWFAGNRVEPGQSRSGQRVFRRFREGTGDDRPFDIHVATPADSAYPGPVRVSVSFAVREPETETPLAVVEAGLDPAFFHDLLQGGSDRQSQALIVHRDGTILAAEPAQTAWIGTRLDDPPLTLAAAEPRAASVRMVPNRDGRPADLAAIHPFPDWPFAVVLVRPRHEALADAYQVLQHNGLILALVLVGIGMIGWHQHRQATRLTDQANALQASHEALRAGEDRLSLAVEAVGAAVWDWPGGTDRFELSPRHRDMIGVGPDFPDSLDAWLSRTHADDRSALSQSAEAVLEGRTDNHYGEYRIRHEDGSWRWILSRGRARRDDEGRLLRLIGLDIDITDRKAAEEARLQSEQRFRAVFEQAGVGFGLFRPDGRLLAINDRYCEIVGYDRAWILSHKFVDYTHPDDKAISREYADRTLRGEFPSYSLEKRYVRPDGRDVWVNVTVTLLRKPDGSPDYFVGIVEVIDERKRAEQALIRAYRSLSMLSACNEALVRARNEEELLGDISRLIVNIGGYRFACVATREDGEALRTRATAPETDSTGAAEFCRSLLCRDPEFAAPGVTPNAPPAIIRNLPAMPRFASLREQAERFACRSAVALPVQAGHYLVGRLLIVSADPQAFGDDELSLLGQLASDLAYGLQAQRTSEARRAAERAARESENRVRLLLESTAEAIIGVDRDGRITFCNRAAMDLMDLSPPNILIGSHIHEEMHVRTASEAPVSPATCPICTAIREGRPIHREDLLLPRRSGAHTPIEYWSHPVRRDGVLSGAVVTFLDISERRIAEERYRQALKMEAVGQLTGGIAHDFNNLLAVIVGNLELLEERLEEGAGLQPLIRQALRAAGRGNDLTSRLLAFARREPLQRQRININDTLAEAAEIMARTFSDVITLDVRADPALWPCIADPNQLENALLNLAVNARDAMPAGGRLTLATANLTLAAPCNLAGGALPAGDYVTLSVTDTGVGMSAETAARACEPFFTTKGARQGSGLGLSMVYGFVTQAGGQLDIVSREGEGATVTLYLPRADDPDSRAPASAAGTARENAAEPGRQDSGKTGRQ
ncbi:MAG: PAS domain S-box protein [Alphaproteobacteria bacterium]|jgi:PAS domain S-box-containing protein|nr:PAS domain S-box protein [Alphaproteobacteria bacterium]